MHNSIPKERLELRAKPQQARSSAKFGHILDTAIDVLEQDGWDGFSTNVLAKRAGIGIQTLYRYFPNKLSVVATLAQRIIAEWDEWFAEFDSFVSNDFEQDAASGLRFFLEKLKNQPGGVAIRRAMNASPVLRGMDMDGNRRLARGFAEAFARQCKRADSDELFYVFLTVIEASLAIADLAIDSPDTDAEKMIDEFVLMQMLFIKEKTRQIQSSSQGNSK